MNSTPSNGAMGGYSQSGLGGATGGMPGGLGGSSNGQSQQGNAMDTINQAYTGIQQYAGLSGLLNQGMKLLFNIHLTVSRLQSSCGLVASSSSSS